MAGVKTSIPFHRRVLRHPDFLAGRYDTGFVERLAPAKPDRDLFPLAAALVARVFGDEGALVLEQKGKAAREGQVVVTAFEGTARVADESFEFDAVELATGSWSLLVAGRVHGAYFRQRKPGRFEVRVWDSEGSQDFSLQRVETS